MSQIDSQFYDQLAQRLNRQDDALGRIECAQDGLMKLLTDHEATEAVHRGMTRSSITWLKWIMTGIWGVVLSIIGYLLKH